MLRFLINQRRYHKSHSINQVAMMANSEKISGLKYYFYCILNMNYTKIYLLIYKLLIRNHLTISNIFIKYELYKNIFINL